MKVQLQSTTKIIQFNGLPARIWEGITESGIKCHAYITRIAVHESETRVDEFEAELKEMKPPSKEIESIPLKLII